MVRAERSIPLTAEAETIGPRLSVEHVGDDEGRRIEDWIACALGDFSASGRDADWQESIGEKVVHSKRRAKPRSRKDAARARGWSRFLLSRRRGITVLTLTDINLVREPELRELAGDLLALVEAGHHRIVLNFEGVERLSSWAVGTVADVHRRCASVRGGALKVCGLRSGLAAIFALTALHRKITLYASEAAALESPWPAVPDLKPLPVAVLAALTRTGDLRRLGGDEPPRWAECDPVDPSILSEDIPPMSGVWLIAQVGPSKGRAIAVEGTKFVIGRDPSCHLRPGAAAVSRYHAAIERRGRRLFLIDLGSTNGTILNDRILRGEEAELHHGDRVQVGPLEFALSVGPNRPQLTGAEDLVAYWLRGSRPNARRAVADDEAETVEFPVPEGLDGTILIKREIVEGVLVVTPLIAELDDEATIGPLRKELLDHYARSSPRRVVINLEYVGHLSGRAVGVLVAHHLKLDRTGGALRVCQAHARVEALLEQVQIAMLVECHATVDDAVLAAWPQLADDPGPAAG